ncbi:response regulator transcription factor [Yersinia hibernica]|uniref:LuxR family transcriptional regulator n=1 Tax=Yersinia hibernica TaxID=2339259 RepID=A0ABX5R0C9_9GAMM|nr:helix-turn-helix transcriptional regulator [Yersinia hibernica]QAX79046.1 LuxR family transcriptional regulator [Yersinia hibernica]
MKDIIIFSQYDLLRFYLNNLINKLIIDKDLKDVINVTVCSSFSDLELHVIKTKKAFIIIDTDDISKPELFRVSHFIHAVNSRICLFTKEHEFSQGYTGLMLDFSSSLLSKTASQSHIENSIYKFIFNDDATYQQGSKVNAKRILTTREAEVCELILSGMTNYDIAKKLAISHKTVSAHKKSIHTKYEAKNLIDLYQRLK